MKMNKKLAMGVSFCLGAVMMATTAFADIASKTGYDQLKDVVKYTASNCSDKLQSFTVEMTGTLRDNDKIVTTSTNVQKYDNAGKKTENRTVTEAADGTKSNAYSYRDAQGTIWYNESNDTYYTYDYSGAKDQKLFTNPFDEEKAGDLEKILDALIGNLKDYVVVDQKADGSKELSGSLTEGQIPALVNAVVSFGLKQSFSSGAPTVNSTLPQVKEDIFIKNVKGKASVNKDGLIESMLITGELSGKDKDGNIHAVAIEYLIKMTGINATTVNKPDLTGKKVEKNVQKALDEELVPEKYVGKYKGDIVIEKDGRFVKIGERTVEIAHIDDKTVAGKYTEQYKGEYAASYGPDRQFNFDAEIKDSRGANFKYTNSAGKIDYGNINFDPMNGEIFVYAGKNTTARLHRVFEE